MGPTGWWVTPLARYQASAASIAGGLPITDRCFSIFSGGTPFARQPGAQPFGVVGEVVRAGLRIEEAAVVAGPAFLLAVRQGQGAVERLRMRAGQHRQRGEAVGILVGDVPGEAAAPVVAGQMEAVRGLAEVRGNGERVGDQQVDAVFRMVGRIGPRLCRVAALVGRHGAIAGLPRASTCASQK